ncbi:MAG: hypothetical protein RPR97_03235 [Colwellia sp.]|jgi:hypothetical protein
MQAKKTFKYSVIATVLALAACGGDINVNSSVDDSVGDTYIENLTSIRYFCLKKAIIM